MRKTLLYFFLALVSLIFIGLINFNKKIKFEYKSFNLSSEGIAVLTGGKGRIKLGLELISKYKNRKLIISGVDKKVTMQSIVPKTLIKKNLITIDKLSESTFQNALVISDWIKKNNFKNITIITSYYHMPRTMLLIKTLAPQYNYYPYPVKRTIPKKPTIKDNIFYYAFLTEEYIKYLLSHIIIIV